MEDASDDDKDFSLFEEPSDYYKPEPQPTFQRHILRSGEQLEVRLVGRNPLWGHMLWNAGRCFAEFLEDNASLYVTNRRVLELGAGAGLPSIVCAIQGAQSVVVTDYPDVELIENLRYNIEHCLRSNSSHNVIALGHVWGGDPDPLLKSLCIDETRRKFDTLILADLLFNHSEHQRLVTTIQETLDHSASACALVFFTPYRPWLLPKDLAFFDLARDAGFVVEKLFEVLMDEVMFDKDPGDETLRRTVFGFKLGWGAIADADE